MRFFEPDSRKLLQEVATCHHTQLQELIRGEAAEG
jgi:hypothetical protein